MDTQQVGRSRAWVLFQVETPEKMAETLHGQFGYDGGHDFVVVRADVVDYGYNIVVPVDAANDQMLDYVIGQICELVGGSEPLVLKVRQHNPPIPHMADGYVTAEEYAANEDPCVKAGRQQTSPGANAWG